MSAEHELAVRNLVGRYAHAVTARDEASWAATWTDDAEWHVIGMHAQGRDGVVALWNKLIGTLPFVVQIPTGGVIELDGDRGTGRWTMREIGKDRLGKGLFTLGIYRDHYVRQDGQWLFSKRRFDALYMGPPDLSSPTHPLPEDG